MLYTATTRARKNVTLIGDGAFRACIENGVRCNERQTLLKEDSVKDVSQIQIATR